MKLGLLIFSALLAPSAFAGSFSHRLHYFGQMLSLEDCRVQLNEVAQRFAAASGVEVLGSDCVKSAYYSGGIDGEILYLAPNRVAVTNTDVRDIMRFDGYYSRVADCQAAAQREEALLRDLTGLNAYVSYCYRVSEIGAPKYRSRIEAIGTSEIKKFNSVSSFFDTPVDAPALLQVAQGITQDLGLHLVESGIGRDFSGFHLAVDYYSATQFYIHADQELKFETDLQCTQSAQNAQSSWTEQDLPIYFFCTKNGRSFGLTHLWFSKKLFSEGDFDTKILPISFASIDDCMSKKTALVEKLTQAGSTISGAACGLNEGQPRLMVFEKRQNREP